MPEPTKDCEFSFYVLCFIGYWILVDDALSTEQGREKVREAFRTGALAAGSFEALQEIPEFQAAMRDIDLAHQGVIAGVPKEANLSTDPSQVAPTEGTV